MISSDGSGSTPREFPVVALFAKKLAHDINNFSTVVRTYSELLLADLPPGSTRDDVAEIHRAADATVTYLQRIARFARAGSMRPTPQSVMPTLRGAVEELAEARDAAAVQLTGHSDQLVSVDAVWLRDVVREVVLNAREAAPASSMVTVVVRHDTDGGGQEWVVIDVQDHGPGFAASVDANAEDPFVTTKESVRGAGFGLTIAAAFAAASGNRLVRARRRVDDAEMTSVALWLRVHVGCGGRVRR